MSRTSFRKGDFDSPLSRREWLTLAASGVTAVSMSGWMEQLAAAAADNPQRRRACILLWMPGGPSQMDTFDLKPGHANGGPYHAIPTSVPGIRISEHLPRLAQQMRDMVLIRSMSSREADHGRATYYLHTGYLQQGAIQYPTLGSLISKELGSDTSALPNFVSIAPYRRFNPAAFASGFLGPRYAPLLVGDQINPFVNRPGQENNYEEALRVEDLLPPGEVSQAQVNSRIDILQHMERDFVNRHPSSSGRSHQTAYQRAVRMMRTDAREAFNLDGEPDRIRDRYGRNLFGQGCLLARRLVERGVPFVEVALSGVNGNALGWDTHQQNFDRVRELSAVLDPAWASLMEDLRARNLLSSTQIVWMGEFGRTPRINRGQGRDHFPQAWSTVLAGGGVRGGRTYGATSADGMRVDSDQPTSVPDFLATICRALGLNPRTQNMSNVGRPIRLADPTARPIEEIIA